MGKPIDLNLNLSDSYEDQIVYLIKKYPVGYVRIIETNKQANHLLNYVKNFKDNLCEPFVNAGLKLQIANSVRHKHIFCPAVQQKINALMLSYDLHTNNPIDQICKIYQNDPEHCISTLKKNICYKHLKIFIETCDINNTKLFKTADFSIKVFNIIKRKASLTKRGARKYENYIRFKIMDFLKNDPVKQLKYLVKLGKPIQLINQHFPKLKQYIIKNTPLLNNKKYKFATRCYWILHGITSFEDKRYICPHCKKSYIKNKNVYEIWKGYRKFCSNKCRANDPVLMQTCISKGWQTKKKNKTTSSSKPENNLYEILCRIYGEQNVKRNWDGDPRYPFHCDFYIIPTDTFIECNLYWMHGFHEFDKNNILDLQKLNKYKQKASTHPAYNYAIKVWTISDPIKIKTAKQNNLNYIILWNEKELNQYAKKLLKENNDN